MKNKIALKLSIYFAIVLLIFSLIVGGIFVYLFKNNTVEIHKKELFTYAETLTKSISLQENYRPYLKFIMDITDTDVWILDENMENINIHRDNLIQREKGNMKGKLSFTELPTNAEKLIEQVFKGETVYSESFSETIGQPTITIGAPVKDLDSGKINYVLLLHSPIEGTTEAVNKAVSLLMLSIFLALLLTYILSMILSYSFTKPLNKMKKTALKLSEGDYTAQSNIKLNDEIGELSNTIDMLASRLDEASKESERLEKLRQDFVANISHELRTPITVIRGSLEALDEKVVTDTQKVESYYTQMLNESKTLERIVDDLLDLSKLQNIDFKIEMSDVNLNELLDDLVKSAKQLAKEKNIEIKTNILKEELVIKGDYGRLRQMFMIIIDNAIKFSPENGIVEINANKNIISIKDYGKGINEKLLPQIFDRFIKTQSEENKEGLGLGLTIAKQIAERHNIKLTAENHDNGAIFTSEI